MPDDERTNNEELRKQLREALAHIEQRERENRQLREQLEQAQQQAARQAAPFRREPRQKIPAAQQKRPGRKAGHQGFHRALPPTIDETIELPLTQCPHCGGPVRDCQRLEQIIEEIPPVRAGGRTDEQPGGTRVTPGGDRPQTVLRQQDPAGPGLLESGYEACLKHELAKRGLRVEQQGVLPVRYDGITIDLGYRLDLLVAGEIIVELKAVEKVTPPHEAQLLSCLKLSGKKVGL